MTELARLFTQIALLRRGPQDVPASPLLLVAAVAAYFAVNVVLTSLLPRTSGPWVWILVVDVVFMLAWFTLLLRLMGRPERVLQTTTAVFGFLVVLAPLSVICGWLVTHFRDDPTWQLPTSLAYLVVVVWTIAAMAHVLKAALEWSTAPTVALVILQLLVEFLVLSTLFPVAR